MHGIPFLVGVAQAVVDRLALRDFTLPAIPWGLTAMMLAHRHPERMLSFTDIEGNVAPEDCFLSRQMFTHQSDDSTVSLRAFAARAYMADESASALYPSIALAEVGSRVVRGVFESMVDVSDNGDLLTRLTSLPFPCCSCVAPRTLAFRTSWSKVFSSQRSREAATGRCTRTQSPCGARSLASSTSDSSDVRNDGTTNRGQT